MDTLRAIYSRASVREFEDRPIPDELLHAVLLAGMCGPSCVNARDWTFVVVRARDMLERMAAANGRPARPLVRAAAGILVCGDLSRAFAGAPDYWVIDCAIAAQNMTLAAHASGLGSVWLGTWPQPERVRAQAELLGLPEGIVPHSILALGYPAGGAARDGSQAAAEVRWEADRVHMEHW